MMMDEHCELKNGEIFQNYACLLNCVDGKSDKFYRIQLLRNVNGFHVWTRWGRNGTEGQSKLEGPISQADAVKNFERKFMEKTKNAWNKREQFKAVKGKYTLVERTSGCVGKTLQKPDLPADLSSNMQLPVDILYTIFLHLSLRDVLRCVQVCKSWKILLNDKYFWKMYIQRNFDLGIKCDFSNEGPMAQWSDKWHCYFEDDVDNKDDIYVMRPFPSMWNCRVVHPHGLDPLSGDVKTLQGLCRSLEILIYMRNESSRLGMCNDTRCSAKYKGKHDICAVLFPWDKEDLPTPLELLDEIFHFHPQIFAYYFNYPNDMGELQENKLNFHLVRDNTPDSSDYEEDEEHDLDEKPCLNRICEMDFPDKDTMQKFEDCQKFYKWLQPIMDPSLTVYAGEEKFNPVAVFMVTHLAPGWVGGALTAVTYT
ncbi:uncharacterized protein LOC114521157 isoform X2 [Dendronephthya gigantea]|uniref:uncharacterized protein LOC114521157 isoform X2 n=1 Tax=Dendronephthya gigantea TaxID=151771 RepID=UPI00106D348C|nr:uncharacterized protein LOC114521157 isoform X2 [Dendronephthya gigantea]